MSRFSHFAKVLGPGILFASTAIGVSHLVQSTRGGADLGFAVIPFVIAANVLKFPFFEYGSRYANVKGKSIIDGYAEIGKWMLFIYILIQLVSMFFVSSAVGAVTSGFLQNLFGLAASPHVVTATLFAICMLILVIGKYQILDKLIKVIGGTLLITTLFAFILALIKGPNPAANEFVAPEIFSDNSILFLIALMGWMPTAVDLSAWNSLWTIERIKESGYKPTLKQTLLDFNLGYWISAVLAIFFVVMGSYMLYGSGKPLSNNSAAFANEVVQIYTGFIGGWSYFIIAIAAFSIMFGTCIAVFDGYGRSMTRSLELMFNRDLRSGYVISIMITVIGSFLIIYFFGKNMKSLVDVATSISFLIAPIVAVVNFRLVMKDFPDESKPGLFLRILSWTGILFLFGFAAYYIYILLS
ncbi:MAG: divalent metal cation transporter [Bacteroidetes bacterium]|nr:MAG: divalent metal cation transporter [Bacteroidota bacterium]